MGKIHGDREDVRVFCFHVVIGARVVEKGAIASKGNGQAMNATMLRTGLEHTALNHSIAESNDHKVLYISWINDRDTGLGCFTSLSGSDAGSRDNSTAESNMWACIAASRCRIGGW